MKDSHAQSLESNRPQPVVGEIVGRGKDARRFVRVGDWMLVAWVGHGEEDEPRIRDLDLAERLGYKDPHKIRTLIRRLARDGKFSRHGVLLKQAETSSAGGRPAVEFWLTEAQALKVVAKSETEVADMILDEVIAVFVLARRGLLPQQQNAVIAELRAGMADLKAANDNLSARLDAEHKARLALEARVEQATRDTGLISRRGAREILNRCRRLAELRRGPWSPETKREHLRAQMQIRDEVLGGWWGAGKSWRCLPNGEKYFAVIRWLDGRIREEIARQEVRAAGRQLAMFGVA